MKIIISESKLVNLFKQRYGVDFSGRVQKITDHKDLPNRFRWFSKKFFDSYLNRIPGEIMPFYLINDGNKQYLYHFSNIPQEDLDDMIIDEDMVDERGRIVSVEDFKKSNNIPNIGISLPDIFDMYINQ
jgi:hypothetical protein